MDEYNYTLNKESIYHEYDYDDYYEIRTINVQNTNQYDDKPIDFSQHDHYIETEPIQNEQDTARKHNRLRDVGLPADLLDLDKNEEHLALLMKKGKATFNTKTEKIDTSVDINDEDINKVVSIAINYPSNIDVKGSYVTHTKQSSEVNKRIKSYRRNNNRNNTVVGVMFNLIKFWHNNIRLECKCISESCLCINQTLLSLASTIGLNADEIIHVDNMRVINRINNHLWLILPLVFESRVVFTELDKIIRVIMDVKQHD